MAAGGGIEDDGVTWREAKHPFLVPVRALSKLVRGKFRALLEKRCPLLAPPVPTEVWNKDWVAWCKHWGGETAVLDYLARYVHRIAITNRRIIAMDKHTVAFRYKNRKTKSWHTCTLKGHEFMRRFLQHVLPKGLHKVRYYGQWHCTKRSWRQKARLVLGREEKDNAHNSLQDNSVLEQQSAERIDDAKACAGPSCPHCGSDATLHMGLLPRRNRASCSARASPPSAH